ncbi:PilZ domain-containing protein [Photobacterium carnosum]|uniref:PilZ domain-containing protein n=1 Tax=Photobacterium carnosum TaxID=2023717 RepID=UPI001E4350D2|nr:PilZ domain-containing protein [Photobacterium carnosum]MCD9529602.1 PilZ domain-containing protein [Photobacterium carnosum]MCD9537397.1 PilZ domain-containing protein [Photobacterium carnosum]MCF2153483.1 PilZ domain-containing protein [Photobacterium carnosum]MCF2161943.1 PilZ domain-containing protein [Photobacterium carnosum]MCF2215294.1 PilZ domain-containing protein [Photobacterium carnosum]
MHLDDYKPLIEQLLPIYNQPDFEAVFQLLTQHESGPIRLQIKMEINRLMTPCNKIIDLRGRVKGQCRQYTFKGLNHWLDDVAINIYHHRKAIFADQYCYGLYEELINTHNNFRILHQQQKISPSNTTPTDTQYSLFQAQLIRFGYYLNREEKRLSIATQIALTLANEQQILATTVDLSLSGARCKVPTAFDYQLGQTITASFPQLAQQYQDARLNQSHYYRILAIDDIQENDSIKWLRLLALTDNTALQAIIKHDQHQSLSLKNHDDKIIQLRTQGYEHCYLKHTITMPLFFAGENLKYSLLTDHNQHQWQYWHDERNQPVINHLLSATRIKNLELSGISHTSTLIYSFFHEHQGQRYFYSAALPEMTRQQRLLFWQIGAKRESWRVMRLTIYPLTQNDTQTLAQLTPEMMPYCQDLSHIGTLQDLTHAEVQPDYLCGMPSTLSAQELNQFRHPRNPISQAEAIHFDPKPLRSESRFNYKTSIVLQQNQHRISGYLIDFSSRGLNIHLDQPLRCKQGDIVLIEFTQLARSTKNDILKKMPYQIIRTSPNGKNIQLITIENEDGLLGGQFLRTLIEFNLEKLALCKEPQPSPAMLLTMHQMLLTRLHSLPYFAEKVDHKIKIKAVGSNFPLSPLANMLHQLSDNDRLDLDIIFKQRVKEMLANPMRPRDKPQSPFIHELYLAVEYHDNQIHKIETKLRGDFEDLATQRVYIQQARQQGELFALRITALPLLNPLTILISQKLSKLARLSLHRARALEIEFTSLMGCGEIFDITDEVLIRLEIH